MPWLTESAQIDLVLDAGRSRGWKIDDWWRDEAAVDRWWKSQGYLYDVDGAAAVPSGEGVVAWIGLLLRPKIGGEPVFVLAALAPDTGEKWRTQEQLTSKDGFPPDWITRWRAPDVLRVPRGAKVVGGEWVACRTFDGRGRIGIARTVTASGMPETVQLNAAGLIADCASLSKRWFKLDQRDESCAWHFERGQTEWKAYIAMLSGLARKQKQLAAGLGLDFRAQKERKDLLKKEIAPIRRSAAEAPAQNAIPPKPLPYDGLAEDPPWADDRLSMADMNRRWPLWGAHRRALRDAGDHAGAEAMRLTNPTDYEVWAAWHLIYGD